MGDMNEFDRMFDKAFEEAARNHRMAPDSTASWKRVERMMMRRKKRKQLLKMFPFAAASFLLGAFLFGTPAVTKAFTPFFQSINSLPNHLVSFIFGSNDQSASQSKTAPPNDALAAGSDGLDESNGEMVEKQYQSWEAASQEMKAFNSLSLHEPPYKFEIVDVTLFFRQGEEQASKAVVLYSNESKQRLMLTIRELNKNETLASFNRKDDGSYEVVQINGSEAYLFMGHDHRASLQFLFMNMHIAISGNLTKEEIIAIGESL